MSSSTHLYTLSRSRIALNPWRIIHDGEGCGRYPTQEEATRDAFRLRDTIVTKIDEAAKVVWCVSKAAPIPVANLRRGGQHAGSVTTG